MSAQRPLFTPPGTSWTPPAELPRLESARVIAIDVETEDPHLKTKGPGDCRRDGRVVGIAVGVEDGGRWYLPFGHERGPNLDRGVVLNWAREELGKSRALKVGANIMYDLGWLAAEGVEVPGPFYDVQFAAALLDEHARSYALDVLGRQELGEAKTSDTMYQWLAEANGGHPTGKDQAGRIHLAPASVVGPYAEGDVDLPLRIREKQLSRIAVEGLEGICDLEMALIPMLVAMRRRGVRVDLKRAERARRELWTLKEEQLRRIERLAGVRGCDVWSAQSVARAFDNVGEHYPRTTTGKPSFTAAWLEHHPHELGQAVREARQYDKTIGTFIDGHVLGHQHNGLIHADIHPLRRADEEEEEGTVSGRFSYSRPNLQQLPSRNEELQRLIRSIFVPHHGQWVKQDFSQIEYRLMVHAAVGPGAEAARRAYREDPKKDYHRYTQDLLQTLLRQKLSRKPVKNVNFMIIFGGGRSKLKSMLGLADHEAERFLDAYDDALPFARRTLRAAARRAERRGYIKTVLGRRARFPLWESSDWDESREKGVFSSREVAEEKCKHLVRRARTHKSLNAYTQGSGADIMKQAMRLIWESGVCDVLGPPMITVHDELDWSADDSREHQEALVESRHLMETAVKLKVPVLVEEERGPSWGELE